MHNKEELMKPSKMSKSVFENWWSRLCTYEDEDAFFKTSRHRGRLEFETLVTEKFVTTMERRWLDLGFCTTYFQRKKLTNFVPLLKQETRKLSKRPQNVSYQFWAVSEMETFPKHGNTPCRAFSCFLDQKNLNNIIWARHYNRRKSNTKTRGNYNLHWEGRRETAQEKKKSFKSFTCQ